MSARRNENRSVFLPALLAVVVMAAAGCGFDQAAAPPSGPDGSTLEGEVLETMNAAGYTYVRVRTDEGEVWAAGPKTAVSVGNRVKVPTGMIMRDFKSMALDRTFEEIYFVETIEVANIPEPAVHAESTGDTGHARNTAATDPDTESIPKPEGGFTIAELFARRGELSGKEILVRGKVVKYSAGIMGRNWIHIQDGTGEAGSNDLAVTTQTGVNVGDVILVKGKATVDKDFGAGYRYDLIIEKATVTVE